MCTIQYLQIPSHTSGQLQLEVQKTTSLHNMTYTILINFFPHLRPVTSTQKNKFTQHVLYNTYKFLPTPPAK